jgi:hypothetical protein
MSLFDNIPEGLDDVIHAVLTETDADVLKVAIKAGAGLAAIITAVSAVKYAIDKDKVKDLSELVNASTGMVEAVVPGKEIKGAISSVFGKEN